MLLKKRNEKEKKQWKPWEVYESHKKCLHISPPWKFQTYIKNLRKEVIWNNIVFPQKCSDAAPNRILEISTHFGASGDQAVSFWRFISNFLLSIYGGASQKRKYNEHDFYAFDFGTKMILCTNFRCSSRRKLHIWSWISGQKLSPKVPWHEMNKYMNENVYLKKEIANKS